MAKRVRPDDLAKPVPHVGPAKTVIDTVLGGVLAAGNGVVTLLAGLLAGVLVLYSGYVVYDSFSTQYKAYESAWDLLQYKPEYITDNQTPLGASELEDINDDYRAWLTIYETSIDYPVLQGENDLYYASHNIYREASLTGAIYLASANSGDLSDSYNLIYGHHMSNGAMFGRLDDFRDTEYFKAHQEGIIVTRSGAYDIRLFAVATTDAYESQIYNVGNRAEEVLAFLGGGYQTNAVGVGTDLIQYDAETAAGAEKVIALSTCANAQTSGRLVVFGTMTRRNLISLTAEGYEGVYDGQPHGPNRAEASIEGAAIEYSLDGGVTWTDETPTITNVGELAVLMRGATAVDGVAESTLVLRVLPRPVTVTANDTGKISGQQDPGFTATVVGLLNSDTVNYTITRVGGGEDAGVYVGALVPSGEALQGNYRVTYVPGDFTINTRGPLTVDVTGTEAVYDGHPHTITATPSVTEGTTVEYSTDGGQTWTTTAPAYTDAGDYPITVRATNPNYETATTETVLHIAPATGLEIGVTQADSVYDGNPHTVTGVPSVTEGTTVEYSTDGGQTWTTTPPSFIEVGNYTVDIRATNPNYVTATTQTVLHITPATNPTTPGSSGSSTPSNPDSPDESETVSRTIVKVWVDSDTSARPASMSMVLTGGSVARTVVLSEANGWRATVDGLEPDAEYVWVEPDISGYRQTSMVTEGDVTTVTNTRVTGDSRPGSSGGGGSGGGGSSGGGTYTLTVRYRYLDGTTAAQTYTASLRRGQRFRVTSPEIEGYIAVPAVVSGTMRGRNTEYTVTYVPEDEDVVIEDYGTPLGLGGVYIQSGSDCFE